MTSAVVAIGDDEYCPRGAMAGCQAAGAAPAKEHKRDTPNWAEINGQDECRLKRACTLDESDEDEVSDVESLDSVNADDVD